MARLALHVHVSDSQGRTFVFGPEDEVPEWTHDIITNPAAWSEPPASNVSRSEPKPATKRTAPRRRAAGGGADQ